MTDPRSMLDEPRLRAALRLEADEVPPRIDPALIAAAARVADRRSSDLVPTIALAFVAGWVASEVWRIALGTAAGLVGGDAIDLVVRAIVAAAPVAAPVVALVSASAVPLGLALTVLTLIALQQRRTQGA